MGIGIEMGIVVVLSVSVLVLLLAMAVDMLVLVLLRFTGFGRGKSHLPLVVRSWGSHERLQGPVRHLCRDARSQVLRCSGFRGFSVSWPAFYWGTAP